MAKKRGDLRTYQGGHFRGAGRSESARKLLFTQGLSTILAIRPWASRTQCPMTRLVDR
jgi:hypothetical protein